MKHLLIFILLIAGFEASKAQISLAPSSVFIDPQTKSASMAIINNSDKPKEISVTIRYGYIDYNEEGNPYIKFDDTLTDRHFSLNQYIKVIPNKLLIDAGEEAKINYLLKMPADLPDGTYYTRVIIQANNKKSIIGDSISKKYDSNIEITTKIIGAVIYMKGEVSTSAEVSYVNHNVSDSLVNLFVHFSRAGGNSPFFGRMNIHIFDENGTEVDSLIDSYFVIYFGGRQKFSFDARKLKSGKYKAEIFADTERQDIPQRYIIPTEGIHKVYEFEIGK